MQIEKVHFVYGYIHNPTHPVIVVLAGCGGTGTHMAINMALLDATLLQLNHPGLHVYLYDPDKVEKHNIGRQMFYPGDVGKNKAEVIAARINLTFGTDWMAETTKYGDKDNDDHRPHIIVSCVDSAKERLNILSATEWERGGRTTDQYWLDTGNAVNTGNVILGSTKIKQPKSKKFKTIAKLKPVSDMFDLEKIKDDNTASCSAFEALKRQSLTINKIVADFAYNMLWKLFSELYITHKGYWINMETGRVSPIPVS